MKIFHIKTIREGQMIWCTCKEEPSVYGFYHSEGEASSHLRYLLRLELMYKNQQVPEEEIQLHFEYED